MTTFTDLEKKVFNASIDDCKTEYCIDVRELAETTDLTVNQVKTVRKYFITFLAVDLPQKSLFAGVIPLFYSENRLFVTKGYMLGF